MSEVNSNPAPPPAPPASPRQVLLGLFILFQLAFMIVSNILSFVIWIPSDVTDKPKDLLNRVAPDFVHEKGHGWQWSDQLEANIRRWTQLTGQDQGWALFTAAYKGTGFPAILLVFEDASPEDTGIKGMILDFDPVNGFDLTQKPDSPPVEILLSENEPTDIHRFVRTGKSKLRKYEELFFFDPAPYQATEHEPAESSEKLAERITKRVTRMHGDAQESAIEYLKWRLEGWKKANPNRPAPKQVIMIERFYRIHGPEESFGWDGPFQVPMFRWLPHAGLEGGKPTVEHFYFTKQLFTR